MIVRQLLATAACLGSFALIPRRIEPTKPSKCTEKRRRTWEEREQRRERRRRRGNR